MREIVFLFCTLLIAGCNKYPEGPAFSLRSKQNRLKGHWYVTDAVAENKPVNTSIAAQTKNITKQYADTYTRWQFIEEDGELFQRVYQGTGSSFFQTNVCFFSEDSQYVIVENSWNSVNDSLEILRLTNKELWVKSVRRENVFLDSGQTVLCDVTETVKWKNF